MKRDYHILVHLHIVDCSSIYLLLINHLGKHYTEPAGVRDSQDLEWLTCT